MKTKTKEELLRDIEELRTKLQEAEQKLLDITERKRAEEELLRSRDELEIRIRERTVELAKANEELRNQTKILESFFRHTITPLVFLDRDFNFVRVNDAYAKCCQRDISEFHGHNHFEFYPHEENEAIFRRVVETKTPYQAMAKPFSFPDHPEWGVTYWDWTLTPLLDDKAEVKFLVFSLEDVTERKRTEKELQDISSYARGLIEASLDPLVTISRDGKIMDVNRATELATGVSRENLIENDFSDYFTEPEKAREGYKQVFLKGFVRDYPLAIRHKSGRTTEVLYNATVYENEAGEVQGVFAAARDITDRKETENRIQATNALLSLFSTKSSRKEYLDAVIDLILDWSKCRCGGIRVLDEQGRIPYESYVGFSREFWESENWLSITCDQCACIRIITGNPDPQDGSMITPGGSFRCDNTLEFVCKLTEEEKNRFRGVCVKNGLLTVAIIPVRNGKKVLGAVHLADERDGRVPLKMAEFIESMAPLIGEAVNRFNLEDDIRESENRLRLLSSQLLNVQESERKRVARDIHDSLGASLAAIKYGVEAVLHPMTQSRRPEARTTAKSLETIVSRIQQTIEEVRRIQMDLRPPTLDDLGIIPTIGWFTREFQKIYSHTRIEKEIDLEESEVPSQLKTVIYRVMQESLNNIAKHSNAEVVRLSLVKRGDRIELMIQDNGSGFDPQAILSRKNLKRGFGLTSMRERIELSGGIFGIDSSGGAGTTIRASWPIL